MSSSIDQQRGSLHEQKAAYPPLQFGTRTIFLLVALAALVSAGGHFAGGVGAFGVLELIIVGTWIWIALVRRARFSDIAIPALILGAFGAVLSVAVGEARESANREACVGNLKQLALGILNYEDKRNSLLPAYTTDAAGNRLHSWRGLILTEFCRPQQLKLDEAWDSPSNLPYIAAVGAGEFACPCAKVTAHPAHTSYVAVIGPDTVWRANTGVRLSEITDNHADTILLVEMKNSGIAWAEPRDLDLANLPPGIDKNNLVKSLSNHSAGLNVVFVDGHVETLPLTIPPEQFQALLTKSGGETIDRSTW